MDPLLRLASLSELRISADHLDPKAGAIRSTAAFDLRIAYSDAVDKPAEIARLKKEIDRLEKDIESNQARLADDSFTSKAPGKVVDSLRATWSSPRLNTANFRTASTNFCSVRPRCQIRKIRILARAAEIAFRSDEIVGANGGNSLKPKAGGRPQSAAIPSN